MPPAIAQPARTGVKKIRLVACGSPAAGDDQVGWLLARRLRPLLPEQVDVIEESAGGARIDAWCQGVDVLFIVDAAQATREFPAGSHLQFTYPRDRHRLARTVSQTSHSLSLEQALHLAQTLELLPSEVYIHALAADHFQPGTLPSTALQEPLDRWVPIVRDHVFACLHPMHR